MKKTFITLVFFLFSYISYSQNPWNLTTLGSWNVSNGKPNYLETNNDSINHKDIDTLIGNYNPQNNTYKYLKASQDLTQLHNNFITENDISLTNNDSVWITFISETAGFKNALGFYTYTGAKPNQICDIDSITLIFPNSSKHGSGGELNCGNKVFIGVFPSGTNIGWALFSNSWKANLCESDYKNRLKNWSNIYYSSANLNTNNYDQAALFRFEKYNKWILSFEDIYVPNADKDYADLIYWITTKSGTFSTVPVTLLNFKYKNKKLFWTTSSEENNDFFSIKIFNSNYKYIKTIKKNGAGNSNLIQQYELILNEENVYVELWQTDFDGQTKKLSNLYIQSTKQSQIKVINYNNNLKIYGEYNNLTIYNEEGKIIKYEKSNNQITNLKSGFYILNFNNKTNIKVIKH